MEHATCEPMSAKYKLAGVVTIAYLAVLFCIALFFRLLVFNARGGDHSVYKRAVVDFSSGINPYSYTVNSFANDELDHGYAYLPTLLYILTAMYKLGLLIDPAIPSQVLWKLPTLFADFGVACILYKYFKKRARCWRCLQQLFGFLTRIL